MNPVIPADRCGCRACNTTAWPTHLALQACLSEVRQASQQLRSRRGSAIVETAVAMPLMLFVVFICLQFAWYVTKKVDVETRRASP